MKYETVTGHIIELSPSAVVRAHLEQLESLAADSSVTEADFIAAAYSPSSPILDATVMPGVGFVTPTVAATPEYAIVADLTYRKSLAARGISLEEVAKQYTMTPAQAAEQLGLHVSAVRQAIASGRLASWIKDGRHYLHPDTVRGFAPERRGPAPASQSLHVIFGSDGQRVLKIKSDAPMGERSRVAPGIQAADILSGWKRAAVMTVDKGRGQERLYLLAPATSEETLNVSPMRVSGRFRVVEKVNNAREARRLWDAFPGAGAKS